MIAIGVQTKKSSGCVWTWWCSPSSSVTLRSVTSQPCKPCCSASGTAVSTWFW